MIEIVPGKTEPGRIIRTGNGGGRSRTDDLQNVRAESAESYDSGGERGCTAGCTESPGKAAQAGVHAGADTLPDDAELRAVVTRWPTLPAAIRAAIVTLVNASGAGR